MLDTLKNTLLEMWDKRAVRKDPFSYLDKMIFASNNGDERTFQRMLRDGGRSMLRASWGPDTVKEVMLLATPETFERVLALPETTLDDKKYYLGIATYYRFYDFAERLLQEPGVADQAKKDELLLNELAVNKSYPSLQMAQLLVKYGANLEAAEAAAQKGVDQYKNGVQQSAARVEQQHNNFVKQIKPSA